MESQKKAYLFGISTVILWSTVASAFKISLEYLSVAELLFYAVMFSCLTLLFILLIQGKVDLIIKADKKAWRTGLMFGLLNPFLYYLVLFKAYDLLPAQQAQPINYTWALTLSLLSVPLLGHTLARKDLFAIVVSYIGVYIISTKGEILSFSFDNPFGVMLALGSTVIWSVYWILNIKDKRDPVCGLFINFLCALPIIGVYLAMTEGFRVIPMAGLGGAAYVGCFEMGVAFVLWLNALKHTRSTVKIANLIFLSPFLSLVLIHFLVGEEILRSSMIGLLFIVCGLIIQTKKS